MSEKKGVVIHKYTRNDVNLSKKIDRFYELTKEYTKYQNDVEKYKLIGGGADLNYEKDSFVRNENFDYEFVKDLKKFIGGV